MKILVNNDNTRISGGCRWKVECKATKEGIVMHKHMITYLNCFIYLFQVANQVVQALLTQKVSCGLGIVV